MIDPQRPRRGAEDAQRLAVPHLVAGLAQDPIDDGLFRAFGGGHAGGVGADVVFPPHLALLVGQGARTAADPRDGAVGAFAAGLRGGHAGRGRRRPVGGPPRGIGQPGRDWDRASVPKSLRQNRNQGHCQKNPCGHALASLKGAGSIGFPEKWGKREKGLGLRSWVLGPNTETKTQVLRPKTFSYLPFRSAPTISEPLCPPKPKLLDMATRICRCRAWLGV